MNFSGGCLVPIPVIVWPENQSNGQSPEIAHDSPTEWDWTASGKGSGF